MTAVTIALRNTISADWDRASVIVNRQAGATVNLGDVVYMDDNNKVQPAIGNSTSIKAHAFGIVVGVTNFYAETSAPANAWVAVCVRGPVYGFIGSWGTFADGQVVYVSKTVAGGLDTTIPGTPAYDYVVGNAIDGTSIFVDPGQSTPASV